MKLKLVLFMVGIISFLSAQHTVSGTVKDAETSEALIGANVIVKGTTLGAATDIDGNYSFALSGGKYTLEAMYVGYVSLEERVDITKDTKINFDLKADNFSKEVLVTAERAKVRETPVPFMDIESQTIKREIATQDVVALLNAVPGVYSSEQGGGSGDSRLNIRGFSTENISVMINGVPVNDMENGWVYWSNWSGLGDVTSSMQVQRGLGASKLSSSSIGGTVNIITMATESEAKTKATYTSGEYNTKKFNFSYSTGLMEDDWALSMMFSRKQTDGFVDNTFADDITYFLSIGKLYGNNHSLNFNVVGTPQNHGQRSLLHTVATYAEKGIDWNADWGYLKGDKITLRENFYHKPVVDLNWVWEMDKNTSLNTILYASWGTGGGTGEKPVSAYLEDGSRERSFNYVRINEETNQLDFDRLWFQNTSNADGATNVIRTSNNNHNWYGLISSLDKKIDNISLTVGFDGRYYKGEHYRTVNNLVGGEFLYDDNDINDRTYYISGTNIFSRLATNKEGERYIDDKFDYYNDGLVRQYGLFATAEVKLDDLTAFVNVAADQRGYKRVDYFNYLSDDNRTKKLAEIAGMQTTINGIVDANDRATLQAKYNDLVSLYNTNQESDWESFTGYQIKAGANLNLNDKVNVYANAGVMSKVPLFDAVFINFVNEVNKEVENEKVTSIDLGMGYRTKTVAVNLNGYYTQWKDRYYDQSTRVYIDGTNTYETFNFIAPTGVEQIHQGLELDFRFKPNSMFDIEGSISVQDNKYADNFTLAGSSLNVTDKLVGTFQVKDAYVPDQPMANANLAFTYKNKTKWGDTFYVKPKMRFVGNHYSNFSINDRLTTVGKLVDGTTTNERWRSNTYDGPKNSWKIDNYTKFDLNLGYTFYPQENTAWYKEINFNLNIFNIFDTKYIIDATNNGTSFLQYVSGPGVNVENQDNDKKSAFVFYGRERYVSFGLSINF